MTREFFAAALRLAQRYIEDPLALLPVGELAHEVCVLVEERAAIVEQLTSSRIVQVEHVEDDVVGDYWAATLEDGSRFAFRFVGRGA